MAERHFSSWLDGFLALYKNVPASDCHKYWAGMSTLAGALERRVWWTNGDFYHFPNLYLFLIGEPSTAKSSIGDKVVALLQELPEFELAPDRLNDTTLISELIEVGNRKIFNWDNKQFKDSSFFMYGSEAIRLFSEMSQNTSIIPLITDLYNCNFWSLKPRSKKVTRKHGSEAIYNQCINILACTTATWLMSGILTKNSIEGGLGSRFLYAIVPDEYIEPRPTVISGVEQIELYDMVLADLKAIANLTGPFTADSAFIKAYDDYQIEHSKSQVLLKRTDPILHSCLIRKANTQLMKISMLLSVSENDSMILKARHCHKAWELITRIQKDLPQAFGKFGVAEEVRHTHAVLSYIQSTKLPQVSLAHLYQTFEKQFTVKRTYDAVLDLCRQGRLVVSKESTSRDKIYELVNSPEPEQKHLSLVQSEGQSSQGQS